ncbi:MAG: hypothetical protein MMC33_010466 [Icmadophila ericetorum]|nr:hypothetical protein [Icmadophila ericetorum]
MFEVYNGSPTNPRLLTDPNTATALRNAYWALLEILSWMVARPLRESLELARDSKSITPEEAAVSLQELAAFKTLIRATGLLKLGDDPFTSPSHIGPNVPAQTPAEIHYEILLLKYGPTTIGMFTKSLSYLAYTYTDEARQVLQDRSVIPGRLGSVKSYTMGMPTTVFLCAGQDAANLPRVIALVNDVGWYSNKFSTWAAAARYQRMTSVYKDHVKALAQCVVRNRPGLETAFLGDSHGTSPSADFDLDQAWQQIAKREGLAPATYGYPTVNAMPFHYPGMKARTRCRRCRTIYRYNLVGEPASFAGKTTEWWSCSEVIAYLECGRIGLH